MPVPGSLCPWIRIWVSAVSRAPCLSACRHAPHYEDNRLSLWNCEPTPQLSVFSHKRTAVMVSLHSGRMMTKDEALPECSSLGFLLFLGRVTDPDILKPLSQTSNLQANKTFKTFFNWIFYVFTFQMLSPFLVPHPLPIPLLLWGCSPTHTPTSTPWHSPTLGIKQPRAKGFSSHWCPTRLHMQLEPWIPPCVLFVWWSSPWEFWGFWLVNIVVLPIGLQTPSATSVLSLTTPLGTQFLVQWLAASIHLCICQALAEPLRRQLYQAPVSMHFLASTIVTGFGDCLWDGSPGGAVSEWSFFQSLFHSLSLYFLPYFVPPSKKDCKMPMRLLSTRMITVSLIHL